MNPKVKGIIAILISAIGFSFMSVFFRLAGDLPVFQKSLARNLVAMFIPLFFIIKYKQPIFGKLHQLLIRNMKRAHRDVHDLRLRK